MTALKLINRKLLTLIIIIKYNNLLLIVHILIAGNAHCITAQLSEFTDLTDFI